MVRSKMAENTSSANKFIQHGHVRVGPEVVLDPAFLVTRYAERQAFTHILHALSCLSGTWKTL